MGLKSRLRQYSNANGSLGLALAVVALVVVLIYGCLCLSGWVMAAEPIDLHARLPHLGFLTPLEADFGRRILTAALLGALIGHERRAPDRPAGVRTMALVSLSACLFCISSAYGFVDSPGVHAWDPSRVTASLPTGVGFLGGAVIYKHAKDDHHEVIGLTTATSIWISAAIGVASGCAMYFVAFFGTCMVIAMLRFGPRNPTAEQEGPDSEPSGIIRISEPADMPSDGSVRNPLLKGKLVSRKSLDASR
jgi:hypothetical protein